MDRATRRATKAQVVAEMLHDSLCQEATGRLYEQHSKSALRTKWPMFAGFVSVSRYGTSFAPELDEGDRIADSPEERKAGHQHGQPREASATHSAQATSGTETTRGSAPVQEQRQVQATEDGETPANEQQLASIRKLCAALGGEEPTPGVLTFTGAAALLRTLSRDYNAARRRAG